MRLAGCLRRALLPSVGSARVNYLRRSSLTGPAYSEELVKIDAGGDKKDVATPPAFPAAPAFSAAEELQNKFGCEGVRFLEVAALTIVELKLQNGATTRIVLPGAQITSYKPLRWHGGFEEFLYTVLKGGEDDEVDSTPELRGGVGLLFSREDASSGSLLSLTAKLPWEVEGVVCDPQTSVQVLKLSQHSCHQ